MSGPVRRELRGTMALLTIDRARERNPLDPLTSAALRQALHAAFADDAVRSVAITGAGEAFCAGGDLRQMGSLRDLAPDAAYAWPEAIVGLHKDMLAAPKPVVAAVNGPAYAGGMGLAGMCDVIVSLESATFALPEARLGLFPMIIVGHLSRSLPRKLLLEMMLTGDPMSATDLHRVGFVNRLAASRTGLDDALARYEQSFRAVSPEAVRLGRRTFTLLADMPLAQSLDAAQFLNLPFFHGEDLAEGADAFLNRRPPRWAAQEEA